MLINFVIVLLVTIWPLQIKNKTGLDNKVNWFVDI